MISLNINNLHSPARLLTGIFILLVSCATAQKKENYSDLAYQGKTVAVENNVLSTSQVNDDLHLLIYGLESAYSGKRFLPGNEYQTLLSDLNEIKGPLKTIDLCENIQNAFSKVTDNHLSAWINEKKCLINKGAVASSTVGPNSFHPTSKDQFWNVSILRQKKIPILIISILTFKRNIDPKWNGFLEKVKKGIPHAKAIVIDLRGNSGGDDSKGLELADLLSGQQVPEPYAPTWSTPSPEASQLMMNWIERTLWDLRKDGKVIPQKYLDAENEQKEKISLALNGKLSPYSGKSDRNEKLDLSKILHIPIYLLTDRKCVSSCESTIDFFESNPMVKKVGQNTGGYLHFGNIGDLFLPNSVINVHFGTSYQAYRDGRFLEKKGISPDIYVQDGGDPLKVALEDFIKNHGQ